MPNQVNGRVFLFRMRFSLASLLKGGLFKPYFLWPNFHICICTQCQLSTLLMGISHQCLKLTDKVSLRFCISMNQWCFKLNMPYNYTLGYKMIVVLRWKVNFVPNTSSFRRLNYNPRLTPLTFPYYLFQTSLNFYLFGPLPTERVQNLITKIFSDS